MRCRTEDDDEAGITGCIEATLRALFGAGEDLLARGLTDDREVSRAQIDQLAGCFGGHGLIGSDLFGVTCSAWPATRTSSPWS